MNDGAIIVLLIFIMAVYVVAATWTACPSARYVMVSRSDGEAKYIAIRDIEIVDSRGSKVEIQSIEGNGKVANGAYDTTTAETVPFTGSNRLYFTDKTVPPSSAANKVGPVIAAVTSESASTGFITFVLPCETGISKISIKTVDTPEGRTNMQRVKIVLLDKDKNPIVGCEKVLPTVSIPKNVHHITYT